MRVVPFSVSAEVMDLGEGVLEYVGAISFEGGNLELRVESQTFGLTKPETNRHQVALDDIDRIEFKNGRFGGSTMTLCPASLDAFEGISLAREGKLVLSISKKDRQAAVEFMAVVQTRLDFPESSA